MLTVKRASPVGFIVLAIVVAELFVFIPSTTEEFVTDSFIAPSPEASLSIKGFHAVHLNQQGQKENVDAKEAELFKKQGVAILKDVFVKIYSKGDNTIRITSDSGKYYMETKDLELFGNILVNSENLGYQMKTDYLRYEELKSLLWTDRDVWMAGPNPTKPSLIVTGRGLRAYTQEDRVDLLSDVHCHKFDEKAESIDIDSDRSTFYMEKSEALFQDNVVVRQRDMNIFTDNFLVTYNKRDQGIDRAKAYDIVKIVQGDRIATCQTAFILNREQKIVMRGKPKVVQGTDTVEGKIIIFFTAENKILFDEAVGEVDVQSKSKEKK